MSENRYFTKEIKGIFSKVVQLQIKVNSTCDPPFCGLKCRSCGSILSPAKSGILCQGGWYP